MVAVVSVRSRRGSGVLGGVCWRGGGGVVGFLFVTQRVIEALVEMFGWAG